MIESKVCFVSIDVEHDLAKDSTRKFQGVENLERFLKVFKKHNLPATLFVTGEVLEKYPNLVKEWSKYYEIGSHSFGHKFWDDLSNEERGKDLEKFIYLYQKIFDKNPQGFRAPSHLIDEEGLKILEKKNFLYDSSIIPHYPFFKKYRGYKGRAPLFPYHPSLKDIKKPGEMKILEIPVVGQLGGIPLTGSWIKKMFLFFYRILFSFHQPHFITLNLHCWDSLKPKKLNQILELLKNAKYQFLNGEQICKNFQ